MKVVVTLTKKFFDQHPRAGQPTGFADAVKAGTKIHTCRDNYDYWVKKIDTLKDADGILCIREWTGKPYRSPQGTIKETPAAMVAVSKLELTKGKHRVEPYSHSVEYYRATVDGVPVDVETLAHNDGFTNKRDFTAFLDPLFAKYNTDTITLAIIHFTPYRYGNQDEK